MPGPTPPPVPTLSTPLNHATGVTTAPTLIWNSSTGATSYNLQVSTTANFLSGLIIDITGIIGTSHPISALTFNTTYYWHVSASNFVGPSAFSSTSDFKTEAGPLPPPAPSNTFKGSTAVREFTNNMVNDYSL